jgi:GAF domain-containing protein
MSVWTWVAGIVGGAAIVILLVVGDEDHNFSGRDREALFEGPPQALISAPAAIGAEQAMTIVVAQEEAPAEVQPLLEEVRQLLATAATQSPEEAKPTLQQAKDTLNGAIDQIEAAADDTSNDLTKIRLLRLALVLNRVEDLIQIRLDRL